MKLGIVGLQGSGKSIVFAALTGLAVDPSMKSEDRTAMVNVPDERIDKLSAMYNPKKTIYTKVEYFLPGKKDKDASFQGARTCDALIHVVRGFAIYGEGEPTPLADIKTMNAEFILADLLVVEKRLERLDLDAKRGKKPPQEEIDLFAACKAKLENDEPLRNTPDLALNPLLRGFTLLSAKPMLVLFNNDEETTDLPKDTGQPKDGELYIAMRGQLEQELGAMGEAEAREFLAEFGIAKSAMDRVIVKSYELLGLQSFFTVGEDEVRAWTIRKGTEALDAAEEIHTDIKKGFIRAEVLAYDDLVACGSEAEAKKKGLTRLEGKTYIVKDGDIINFRFNV